jgi:hypothetical protein
LTKQPRDNSYYLRRLERDYPDVLADLRSGKHASVAEAVTAAGLKKPRTRLHEMKNAWAKGSPVERDAFLRSIGATIGPSLTASASPVAGGPTTARIVGFDAQRQLTPAARVRIAEIMHRRGMRKSDVMDELAHDRLNPALWFALARNWRVKQSSLRSAVQDWLDANAEV